MSFRSTSFRSNTARSICAAALSLPACSLLSGCLIGGYGSESGDFLLPGGLGLVFVLCLLLWFLLRRR